MFNLIEKLLDLQLTGLKTPVVDFNCPKCKNYFGFNTWDLQHCPKISCTCDNVFISPVK